MKNNYDAADADERMLKTVLEQKFLELKDERAPQEEAPAELKKEVFNTLNSLILLTDLADLFTVKFAQTNLTFLDPSLEEGWSDDDNK